MHVSDNDFKMICKHVKETIVNNLENKINYNNINDLKFLKWCYNKIYYINKKQIDEISDIIRKYYTYNFVEKGQQKQSDNN